MKISMKVITGSILENDKHCTEKKRNWIVSRAIGKVQVSEKWVAIRNKIPKA